MRVLPPSALNSQCTELVHGWVFYDRHNLDLPRNVARIGVLSPGHVVLVLHDDGTGMEFRFVRGNTADAVVQNEDGSVSHAGSSDEYCAAHAARMLYFQRRTALMQEKHA